MSVEDDELDELEVLVERLQARNHDETLIRLAKDSGKGVYSHLSNAQRRLKISSAVRFYFVYHFDTAPFENEPDSITVRLLFFSQLCIVHFF